MPVSLLQAESPLTEKYSHLGLFHVGGPSFGFDGCFQKQEEKNDYIIYQFNFSEANNRIAIRKMMLTIYLATYYVMDAMLYDKEFFAEKIWDDQALSFIIFDGGKETDGYAIGGQLYPWFKKRLNSLSDQELISLNQHVSSELERVSIYFSQELSYSQVTISRNSFFIQVNMGGRWLSWKLSRFLDKQEEFSSHNIDFHSDQELCFAVIVAMNTWLREN